MRSVLATGLLFASLGVARADYGRLVIVAPTDASVVANGHTLTLANDGYRRVESQDLTPGRSYYYTLTATAYRNGIPYTERQTVSVEAGFETKVTFAFNGATTGGTTGPQPGTVNYPPNATGQPFNPTYPQQVNPGYPQQVNPGYPQQFNPGVPPQGNPGFNPGFNNNFRPGQPSNLNGGGNPGGGYRSPLPGGGKPGVPSQQQPRPPQGQPSGPRR